MEAPLATQGGFMQPPRASAPVKCAAPTDSMDDPKARQVHLEREEGRGQEGRGGMFSRRTPAPGQVAVKTTRRSRGVMGAV